MVGVWSCLELFGVWSLNVEWWCGGASRPFLRPFLSLVSPTCLPAISSLPIAIAFANRHISIACMPAIGHCLCHWCTMRSARPVAGRGRIAPDCNSTETPMSKTRILPSISAAVVAFVWGVLTPPSVYVLRRQDIINNSR